jgi:hypothetical protein
MAKKITASKALNFEAVIFLDNIVRTDHLKNPVLCVKTFI